MIAKTVLLIIGAQGYQPLEYGVTRDVLEKAGIKVVVASDKTGTACSMYTDGPYSTAPVDILLSDVKAQDYDGIFIVGGAVLKALDTQTVHTLVQEIYKLNRPVGAICISPRILAKAKILEGKSATGWNDDGLLNAIFKMYHVNYVQKPVVVDGKIITANGPQAAQEFGNAIIKILNS